jgi:hypothetical protein
MFCAGFDEGEAPGCYGRIMAIVRQDIAEESWRALQECR